MTQLDEYNRMSRDEQRQQDRERYLEEQKAIDARMMRPPDDELERAQGRRSHPYSIGPQPLRRRYNWLEVAQGEPEIPLATPPGKLYFRYRKPDGDDFIGPAANAEAYINKGYKVESEEYIEDLGVYWQEQYAKNTPEGQAYDPGAASKVDSGYPPGSSPDTVERLSALQQATPSEQQNPPA